MPTPVVTFDVGQTLVELDLDFLASRLEAREITVDVARLAHAAPRAWELYDGFVREGIGRPWHAFMTALLEGGGVTNAVPVVDWLWSEQPTRNLWRKPISDMVALTRELAGRGIPVAVLSNSEGRLVELLTGIGIADPFVAIIDSGVVGIAKPDPAIFAHTLAAIGVPDARAIHVGDSWAADVEGALAAGWDAIWYGPNVKPVDDPRVTIARDAAETRAAITRWCA